MAPIALSPTLVALAALALLAPFAAAEEVRTEFDLLGYQEGDGFHFLLEGDPTKNPTLQVPPGAEILVRFTSVSGFHNVRVTGQTGSEFVGAGESTGYTFTSPASGSIEYWCDPHKASGMKGSIRVVDEPTLGSGAPAASADADPTPEATRSTPAFALVAAVGLLGAALLRARGA